LSTPVTASPASAGFVFAANDATSEATTSISVAPLAVQWTVQATDPVTLSEAVLVTPESAQWHFQAHDAIAISPPGPPPPPPVVVRRRGGGGGGGLLPVGPPPPRVSNAQSWAMPPAISGLRVSTEGPPVLFVMAYRDSGHVVRVTLEQAPPLPPIRPRKR
jgi:hypothetical protein